MWLDKHVDPDTFSHWLSISHTWTLYVFVFLRSYYIFKLCMHAVSLHACISLSPFLCSLQVSLTWIYDSNLQHQVPKKIRRFFLLLREREGEREREEKKEKGIWLFKASLWLIRNRKVNQFYGQWETTLLYICVCVCAWQIRHSCVPYPDAAENSRMII